MLLQVYEGHGFHEATDTLLANVSGLSSLSMPFFVVSKRNKITVFLYEEANYDIDECRPRDYTKLSLTYETITSSTFEVNLTQ